MQTNGGADDVRAALAAATKAVKATLPERTAIRRYQAIGRTHERLNAFLRGAPEAPGSARRLMAMRDTLDALLRRAALPVDLVVYRGVPDLRVVVPLGRRLPSTAVQHGFLSTSLSRDVAVRDFVDGSPPGGVLRVLAPAGTNALWLTPLADPLVAQEEEILFRQGMLLTFLRWHTGTDIREVDCEVTR